MVRRYVVSRDYYHYQRELLIVPEYPCQDFKTAILSSGLSFLNPEYTVE